MIICFEFDVVVVIVFCDCSFVICLVFNSVVYSVVGFDSSLFVMIVSLPLFVYVCCLWCLLVSGVCFFMFWFLCFACVGSVSFRLCLFCIVSMIVIFALRLGCYLV